MSVSLEKLFGARRQVDEGEHWLTISDLMAGLMMVFLFISIALMRSAMIERDKIREVAIAYQNSQIELNKELMREFQGNLEEWEATIDDKTLSIEFKSPEVLFGNGQIELQPRFMEILQDFFPRYLGVLQKHARNIDEVRIEGHTSSDWTSATTPGDAYFQNMWLSQGRTRSVLEFVHNLDAVAMNREWVRANVAAVGFSSSRLVKDASGLEDPDASRRVVFRVITNAETQIRKILED